MNGCKKFQDRPLPNKVSDGFQWWRAAHCDAVVWGLHYKGDARMVQVMFDRCYDLADARRQAARRLREAREHLKENSLPSDCDQSE